MSATSAGGGYDRARCRACCWLRQPIGAEQVIYALPYSGIVAVIPCFAGYQPAMAIKNACFSIKDHRGLLMDVCFDDKGDIDRESFLVEVKGGKQVVVETLPPLREN